MATSAITHHVGRTADVQPAAGNKSRATEWIARIAIVGMASALAWHTWAHWGNFQIDNGRELYVPSEILKGKLLFRDLWYMYGPLAPYLKALLFRVFGVSLTVLYVLGLTLTIGTALVLYEITRFFDLGPVGNVVPPLFFLTEAFYPFIRNFVFPYSYAASIGGFLGLACLYFVLKHLASRRDRDLIAATLLCALVVLTKQEIGFACVVLLLFEIAAIYAQHWSRRELFRNLSFFVLGLIPAAIVYAWFIYKMSLKSLLFENWISTPGTYFMRTFSKITMPEQGFRFDAPELAEAVGYSLVGLLLWALFASLAARIIKKFGFRSWPSIAAVGVAALLPLWIFAAAYAVVFPYGVYGETQSPERALTILLTQAIFPKGVFLIVVGCLAAFLWKLKASSRATRDIQSAALALFAAVISLRQMMELRPSILRCAVFFNGAALVVFVLLLAWVLRWAARSLDSHSGNIFTSAMLGAEALLFFTIFHPNPQALPARFSTEYGTQYTVKDASQLLPQVISFMKTHTRNGKDILMLPEPPSLYVFAGMEAPTKWYSLTPGVVAPDDEPEFIRQAESNDVRYVLISNRGFNEYGVRGFINRGFNPRIHDWIVDRFVKVGQIGPTPDAPYPPYIVWIFERKDLVAPGNPPQSVASPDSAANTSPKH